MSDFYNENELLYIFNSNMNALQLLETENAITIFYGLIKLQTDTLTESFGNNQELLNLYAKIQNLTSNDFNYIDNLLTPFLDCNLNFSLPSDVMAKIFLYMDLIEPNIPLPVIVGYNEEDKELTKIIFKTHIELWKYNVMYRSNFYVNSNKLQYTLRSDFPKIDSHITHLISNIFGIPENVVHLKKIDYRYSKLLEISLINLLIKLNYDVPSWSLNFEDHQENTLPQYVAKFMNNLKFNEDEIQMQIILKLIIEFVDNGDEKNKEIEMIKFLFKAVSRLSDIDLSIERYIKEKYLQKEIDLKPLLFINFMKKKCRPLSSENIIEFQNIYKNLKNGDQIPKNICTEQLKIFLRTFRYQDYKIVNYDGELNVLQLWPIKFKEISLEINMINQLKVKYLKLKGLMNFTRPFHFNEALINSIEFSEEECNFLISRVFRFTSFNCAFLCAAIHYYTKGTIYFDLPEMHFYLSLLSPLQLNYSTTNDIFSDLVNQEEVELTSIYELKQNFDVSQFADFYLVDLVINSIKSMASDIYSLKIICNNYKIPEIYLILYLNNTQLTTYDKVVLCLLFLNHNVSKYERIILNNLINKNTQKIKFEKIKNTSFLDYFPDISVNTINFKTIKEHYINLINNNIDISCDYNLLLKYKSHYDFKDIFEYISKYLI